MKGGIYRDERWPDYGIYTDEPDGIEIPDSLYTRYVQANIDYNTVQKELAELYKGQQ